MGSGKTGGAVGRAAGADAGAAEQTGHGGHTGADATAGGALRTGSAVIAAPLVAACTTPEGDPHLPLSHTRSPLQSVSF